MPKSDTWPGSSATEPSSSNMDSAGSCDSVISTNSGFSVDSLQHLSAAERECLMYLEETIDSLDVDEDSGLSNDEPETSHQAAAISRPLRHGVPTPLLLVNGFANLAQMAPADVNEPKTPEVPNDSNAALLETQTRDLETSKRHCEVKETDSKTCSLAPQAQMLASAVGGDCKRCAPSDTKLEPDQSNPQPETDLILIPPPSDFMDEPGPQPQPEERPDPPIYVETPVKSQHLDLEEFRKRASTKRAPVSSDVIHQPVPDKAAADVPETPSAPHSPTITSANLLSEHSEPKSPPAVAPKPKKLPSNIIFKSHKTSADANFSPPASDRMLSDGQKVRMEALRKLGLLKADDADLDQRPSLSTSIKSRKSWASPPSPGARPSTRTSSPAVSTVPLSPPMADVSPQANMALTPAAQAKDILPVPSAFSDTGEPPSLHHSQVASPVKSIISEPTINAGVKSATLAHSGIGLSSLTVSPGSSEVGQVGGANRSLAELRNGRPRPASLGSGKDFSHVKVEALAPSTKDANTRRSTPVAPVSQNAGESTGVSRYHGVSVVICPRAENDEGRRNALKKLGLLKN
ncbi:unnamed protein product [Lota lota]